MIHYRNLRQCLSLGLKLKKMHKILKFKESDWIRFYIDFNTQKRTNSNNESDKNFFKLMNNAVMGKLWKIWEKVKMRIVKNKKEFLKYISKPTCVRWNIYGNILASIYEKKTSLTLNKPI